MPTPNTRNRRPIQRGSGFFDTIHGMQKLYHAARAAAGIAARLRNRNPASRGNARPQNRGRAERHNPFELRQAALTAAQKKTQNPFQRAELARLSGVNLDIVSNPSRQAQQRLSIARQHELEKAFKEFHELSLKHAGQRPPTEPYRQIKNAVLQLMLQEGKINSFEEMREALAQMGVNSKGKFFDLFGKNGIFNKGEIGLLEKIFQKKFEAFMAEWH